MYNNMNNDDYISILDLAITYASRGTSSNIDQVLSAKDIDTIINNLKINNNLFLFFNYTFYLFIPISLATIAFYIANFSKTTSIYAIPLLVVVIVMFALRSKISKINFQRSIKEYSIKATISNVRSISFIFFFNFLNNNHTNIYKFDDSYPTSFKLYRGHKGLRRSLLLPWLLQEKLGLNEIHRPSFLWRAQKLYLKPSEIDLKSHTFTVLRDAFVEPSSLRRVDSETFERVRKFAESLDIKDKSWKDFFEVHAAYHNLIREKGHAPKNKEVQVSGLSFDQVQKYLNPTENRKERKLLFEAAVKAASR